MKKLVPDSIPSDILDDTLALITLVLEQRMDRNGTCTEDLRTADFKKMIELCVGTTGFFHQMTTVKCLPLLNENIRSFSSRVSTFLVAVFGPRRVAEILKVL